MNYSKKKFLKVFFTVIAVTICVQILGEDIPFLSRAIRTTQATDSEFDYKIDNKKVKITAYKGNSSEVVVPKTIDGTKVTAIGTDAFSEMGTIKSIELPSTIKYIESGAFKLCTGLEKIELSKELKTIGDSAFSGCSNLTDIDFPESVESIGAYSFSGTGLTMIQIPSTVENIGTYAFANCFSLKDIELSGSMTVIEDNTFENCGVKEIIIPGSVLSIGSMAFAGCSDLNMVNISASVESIGQYAFEKCTSLTRIEIPNGVNQLGAYAFEGCTALNEISFSQNLEVLNDGLFQNCEALKNIAIPENVQIIGADAFGGCISLEEVIIGEKVRVICDRAFLGCIQLKNVHIGNNTEIIGISSFRNCDSLETVSIGEGVISIGDSAFYDSENLDDIILKSTVMEIVGTDTFNMIGDNAVLTVPVGMSDYYKKLITNETNLKEGSVIIEEGDEIPEFSEIPDESVPEAGMPGEVEPTATPSTDVVPEATVQPEVIPTEVPVTTQTPLPEIITPTVTPAPRQITFNYFDSGNKLINAVSTAQGKTLKLLECEDKEESKFVGWIDLTSSTDKIYAPGTEFVAEEKKEFKALYANIKMLEGAAAKLSSSTGLRFYSRVDMGTYNDIAKYASEFKYGTIICPSNKIEAVSDFTIDNLEQADITYINIPVNVWFNTTDTYMEYTGVVTNILEKNYKLVLSARAYIKIKYSDGIERIIYSDYSDDNKRSVAQVAKAALNDANVYTNEQRKLLQQFTD